jgi:predicted transcriptional regulator
MTQDMYDDNLQSMQQLGRDFEELMRIIDRLSGNKATPTAPLPETPVTGQFTDLAEVDGMKKNVLDSLDPKLKESLIKNLERAEKQGLVEIDFENKKIKLTEKGKDYIKNPEFQKELQLDRAKLTGENNTEIIGIELTGTDSDLLFFKDNKTMDLQAIDFSKATPKMTKKFSDNLKKWHEEGLIKVDGTKISLTDKGLKFIKSPQFLQSLNKFSNLSEALTTGKLAEKALNAVPHGKIVVAIKKVVSAITKTAEVAKSANKALGGDK